jgi:hypothetical protein
MIIIIIIIIIIMYIFKKWESEIISSAIHSYV